MTLISIFRYKTDVTKFLPIRILIKIGAFWITLGTVNSIKE